MAHMGDFNVVLNHDDKFRRHILEVEVRNFNMLLTNTGLIVPKTVDRFYTWTQSYIHNRINRVLINPTWMSM